MFTKDTNKTKDMEKIEDMENRNNHKNQKTDKTVKTASAIFSESLKCLKSLMQIFVESAKPIFATSATSASANFVGKASCERTMRYGVRSMIPSFLFRYSLDPNLSRSRSDCAPRTPSLFKDKSQLSFPSLASLICLCMLTVGVGNAWGASLTYTHDFATTISSAGDVTLSTIKWTASSLSNVGAYNSDYYKGIQIGTGSKSGAITLTSKNNWGAQTGTSFYGYTKVKKVYVWMNSGGSGTVSATVTIGGKSATSDGTTVSKNSSASSQRSGTTKVTYTPAADGKTGAIVITVTKGTASASAGYLCAIQVECEEPDVSYNVDWYVGGTRTKQEIGVSSGTPPSVADNALGGSCSSLKFLGWSETNIGSTPDDAPADLFPSDNVPSLTGNKTFYAVFGDVSYDTDGTPVKKQTHQYDTWTYSGTTTNKTSYRIFGNNAYIQTNALDLSALAKVIVYGGYYGDSGATGISIKDASGNVWKTGNVEGNNAERANNFTDGASLTGTKALKVYSTSGNGTGTGVRISKVEVYTYPAEYSNCVTTCCTPLGYINGSVSWSGGTSATLTWDALSNVDATTPYVVTYRTGSAAYGSSNVGSITTNGAGKKTCTITSLTAGTSYDFKIEVKGASGYCDKDSVMTSTAPKITTTTDENLVDVTYAEGDGPSTNASYFTFSGVGLTGDITVTAPTNFQVSKTSSSSGFGSSVTVSPSTGSITNQKIWIRLASGLTNASSPYGGNVALSGGSAASVNVAVTGSVTSACTEPTVDTPTLTSIASGTITVSCASVTVDENCDVTEYGFVWNESSDPTISDNKTPVGSSTPASGFNDNLSISFTTGTTYKIKAYAVNSAGTTLSSSLTVIPQKVTFNSNGGSDVADKYVNNGGIVSKPSDPTKSNYDFDDWYTDDGTFESNVDFSSTITDDVTYYANWTETLHDVTVEYKCGSTMVKASTTIENVGVVKTGSTTAPNDITGYTWSTWSAMPSGVTTSTTPLTTRAITINATADGKTITANYTANQYDITYKDEGDAAYSGNNEGSLPSKHTYGSATALVNGAKSGYDFLGWYTDDDCTISAGVSIGATAVTAAFTLYAKWAPSKYDVTLKKNGKTAAADQVVRVTYGSAMPDTIKAVGNTAITVPTQNGYTFKGYWDTSASTGGKQYYSYYGTPAVLESANNWDKTSDTNLYGRWEANVYTVTFDNQGADSGHEGVSSIDATYDAAMPSIAENLPTKTGYRFDGYYTAKNGGGTKYYNANGTSATTMQLRSATNTLYAKWVAQLTFSVNGNIDDELTRDDNTAMPSTATVPTACGDCWAFMGWSTNSSESGAPAYAGGATHEFGEPTTLYAVFGKAEYQMINSSSDLVANDNYILTFYYDETDHEYALSNEKKYTYDAAVTDVTSMVRENGEGWFIYNIGANNIWKFTGTKDAGQLYNAASDKYVNLSSTSSDLLNTTDNLTFTNDGIFWTIKSTNYLKPYSYSSFEINSSEPSYSAFLYHQISAEYATEPNCETYDIVWKVNDTPLASGSQTEETNACAGIEELPTDPDDDELDCATKFVGWSEQELVGNGHDAPADLFTAIEDAPIINEDKTFHAVFATGTPIANTFKLANISEIKDGQTVLIVNRNSNVACSNTANGDQLTAVSVSPSDKTISSSESSIRWTVTKSGDYYVFKSGDNYLRSGGNAQLKCDGTSDKWSISAGTVSGTYRMTSYNQSSYSLQYYNSKFTSYSGTGTAYNVDFYIPAESYSDYMTECCEHIVTLSDGSPANGTVTFDPAGSVETCTGAKEVSMTITPNPGYYLSAWTSSGVAPTSVVPAVVTNTANAQTTTLTFAEGSDNGTYTAGATFTAKALEGWTWMYKKDADVADNSVAPYAIPDVVEIYKDQYARFIITGYAPADVIAEKQGYVYSSGGVEPAYTTSYLTWVANTASYFTLKGQNPVESTTITFKAIGDASITRTMTIRVKALPLVHFVDNVHNVAFDDVVATVETGVVTLTKKTPTQDDFDGTTKNTCEETHLHLVGWIDGDWSPYQAYMDGTGEKPTVSAIIGATGYFYAPNVDIDLVAKEGKTFYAVWANVE